MNKFKLMKKKYKIMVLTISLAGLAIILYFIFGNLSRPQNQSISLRLDIVIPQDAYSSKKNIEIIPLSSDSPEYMNLLNYKNFYGDIYKISFTDGTKESSILPVTIRYKLPIESYFGDNFINFSLGYSTNDQIPIVSEFTGERIVKIEDIYYIEAETFHLSKINHIGLVIDSPREANYGLRILKEGLMSIEPDIILIPGTDINFLGEIVNTNQNIYPQTFWSSLFPERTIWNYNYPLINTKSKNYNDSYTNFVERTGLNSYIEFEGRRLAQELSRFPDKNFDIIAHGIGGLIARYAIESNDTLKNVRNLVLISVPNKGTNLANPLFFNLIFNKDLKILSSYFNLEESTLLKSILNVDFYLSQINSYYRDLIPNSKFLENLNSFGLREDVRYLVIAGTDPGINEDISENHFSRLYPEFIQGKGDGIVTIDSAILEGADEFYYSNKSFNEIYNSPDVLDKIVSFLQETVPDLSIEPFKDDNFIEYIYEKENKLEIDKTNIIQPPKIVQQFMLPRNYIENEIITNIDKIGDFREGSVKIVNLQEDIYFKSPSGIYNNKLEKVFSNDILSGLEINNMYYMTTIDGVYVLNQNGRIEKVIENSNISNNQIIYYIPDKGFLNIQNGNIYLNELLMFSGSSFVDLKVQDNVIYIIFNDGIVRLDEEKIVEVINITLLEEIFDINFGEFIEFVTYDNKFFMLFSDYKLVYWESLENNFQLVGDGDIGRLKAQIFDDKLFIFGKDHLTYISLVENNFPGIFQRIEGRLIDILIESNREVWLVLEKNNNIEVFKGELK